MKKLLFIIPLLFIGITYAAPVPDDARAIENYHMLNTYRTDHWHTTLQWHTGLAICIKEYLISQINNDFQWHYGKDWKSTPTLRCSYTNMIGIWENLIASTNYFPWAPRALSLRAGSTLHRKNMLFPTYKYVGIAAVRDPVKKQSRRWQLFAMDTRTTTQPTTQPTTTNNVSLIFNTVITWQLNNSKPSIVSRSIWEPSSVIKWGKRLLRLPVILERDIDRTNISGLSQTLVTNLVNILGPTQ